VTGVGSRWLNNGGLLVGLWGSSNRLVATDGGQVKSATGFVGYNAASSNNLVLITGGAKAECTQYLLVGNYGSRNRLTIADGGALLTTNLVVSETAAAMDNQVLVTGGSLLTERVTVGGYGTGQLTISNGTVRTGRFLVSFSTAGTLTVAGGTLSVTGELTMSYSAGSTSAVWVTGGTVSVLSRWVMGDCGRSNVAETAVSGGNVFVTNASGNAFIDLRSGTLTISGGALRADKLVMTNRCGRFVKTGGAVTIDSLMLDPVLDADGDGLPNGWEMMFGLDPLSAGGDDGADGDADGDGYTNGQEFSAGTAPDNGLSIPTVRDITFSGGNALVKIQSVTGKNYQLQRRDSISSGDWEDVGSPQPGNGGVLELVDPGGAAQPQRLYRVKIPSP
jgi:T5SS/PEP-CTERM-associated repeat protein